MDVDRDTDSEMSEIKPETNTGGSPVRNSPTEDQQGGHITSHVPSRTRDSRADSTDTQASSDNEKPRRSETSTSNMTDASSKQNLEEQRSKNTSSNLSSSTRNKQTDTPVETSTHRVTFTVTISKAIPTGSLSCINDSPQSSAVDDDLAAEGTETKRRRRIVEAPRAQNHFHFEYSLLPLDEEVVKTDVVTYGIAAKIYTERQDPKVLKTWTDKDLTWVAWTHAHTVSITDELLTKLFNHELQLRIWDTRDKLSTRARYDRPKAFKLPPIKSGDDGGGGGVKPIVLKQVASYESLQPKKSYIDRPLPTRTQILPKAENAKAPNRDALLPEGTPSENILNQTQTHEDEGSSSQLRGHRPQSPTPNTLVQVPIRSKRGCSTKSFSRLGKLAGVQPPTEQQQQGYGPRSGHQATQGKSHAKSIGKTSGTSSAEKRADTNNPQDEPVQGDSDRKGSASSQAQAAQTQDMQKVRRSKKQEAAAQARAEHVKKYGICCISIQMAKLFAGLDTVTERLEKPVNGLEDVFITVSLSGPLMSESQHRRLNPLVVKVTSATDMPEKPLSYDELRLRCVPAYVKYKLFDLPVHRSIGREQERHIYWNDIHVVLAGVMEPSVLREYLHGPPVEIEVHDRDRIKEKHKLKPTLFGDDLEDEKISNVGTISSKRTLHNPFLGKDQPWDPYGVAKLDMSGLLLGQKVMHLKIPIHQCDIPDILGMHEDMEDERLIGISGAVDGPESSPLPPGHYIQSGACLKVKVEVAYPLVTPTELAAKVDVEPTPECPFARIVYKFDYKNVTFLIKLQSLITEINATALGLEKMPDHVIKSALSTYKLTMEQQRSRHLDLITGFHLLDGEIHLFVLEGLAQQGVRRIWETIGKPEDPDVLVLYHSNMSFKNRLYGMLDVNFSGIKLHEPLAAIACQPLLYVRDMVPKPCFQAIFRLNQLSQTTKLRAAVRNNLFPTVNMIVSVSKEFGVPMTEEDIQELTPQPPPVKPQKILKMDDGPHTSRIWTPIDNYNTSYMEKLHNRARTGTVIDYPAENKAMIHERSIVNSIERSKSSPMTIRSSTVPAYNYSSQALNSTELAKEALRKILAENPDVRYTYCQEYHHSMTFVPVNVKALKMGEEKASRDAWKTTDGWIYPGKKTMIECNKHPCKLDKARVEELQQPWEELSRLPKGTVIPRSSFPWVHRHEDMDTWTRSLSVFGVDEPVTIHMAGEKLKQEKQQTMEKELREWRSKIVVDDPRTYVHRCATETELKEAGFKSSNQIERLKGLRKDPPVKYSLRKPGMALKEIPPLNVVLNPSVDTESWLAGHDIKPAIDDEFDQKIKGFVPGEESNVSLVRDQNQIPVHDYQHQLFITEHGQDFNVYHKERSNLYKRHINLMTDEDYRLHLFRLPTSYHSLQKYYTLPALDNFENNGFPSPEDRQSVAQTAVETN